jgi:hypothetical protein
MSLAPEYTAVMRAGLLGSIASVVILEIGLRTKSRRALAILLASVTLLLAVELWAWARFAILVRSDYVNAEYRILGPSEWHVFYLHAGPQFLITLIPALVLRALATTSARLRRG